MTVYGIRPDGTRISLGTPVSLFFSREKDAPADLLQARFQRNAALPPLSEVEVTDGTRLWFRGLVDEQNTSLDPSGLQVELVCRSLEAILLDNEALPETLQRPTLPQIEARLLAPFGLKLGAEDPGKTAGPLFVEKGESCWAVLARFCKTEFGDDPWLDGDGLVRCEARTPREWALRGVLSAQLRTLPCKEVREVVKQSSRGRYDTYYRSAAYKAGRPGTPRRRYASMQGGKNPKEVLESGREDSFLLTVTCKGAWLPEKGDTASVSLPGLGTYRACPVRSVRYRSDRSGERTVLNLERPREGGTECG